jgi:hypothetical protein
MVGSGVASSLAWGAMIFIAVGVIVRGIRFHRGTDSGLLVVYRRRGLPGVYRNLGIVAPVLGTYLLIVGLAAAPMLLDFLPSVLLPDPVVGFLWGAFIGWVLIGYAVATRLLYRPPIWLIPSWLRSADVRDGYSAPGPDWFDKGALGTAAISFTVGIVFLGIGVAMGLANDL